MDSKIYFNLRLSLLFIIFSYISYTSEAQSSNVNSGSSVPAMYVFGDSLVDVGNNNYLHFSLDRANFPHNGIDFPTGATGRFSNGKNSVDFIAEKLGLPSPPAYFSISDSDLNKTILTGVSFASGGAGILNGTYSTLRQAVSLSKQVDYYSTVYKILVQELHGYDTAQQHLLKSLFVVVIGSNDLTRYFKADSDISKTSTPQDYVDSMISAINGVLKQLYGLGARKFVFAGVPVVGCAPKQRFQNKTCNGELNFWVTKYDDSLKLALQAFKSEFSDTNYSYFDTYGALVNFIQNPDKYGFTEVLSACCGLGTFRATVPCLPISKYCCNRDDHLFWDFYHPTQKTAGIFIDMFYNTSQYVTPINISQLVSL